MAVTTWGAFNKFRADTVDLDSTQVSTARKSRDYLYDQLKTLSDNNPFFPKITKSFIPFGSFARKTKIRPLDDIDFLMLLVGTGTTEESGSSAYQRKLRLTSDTAPLTRYADDAAYWGAPRYVNSIRVLNSIKSGLSSVSNYGSAEVRRNYEAVVLNLKSYAWSFDIVPALAVSGWNGDITHYLIPDGSGNWKKTDPRIDQSKITTANSQHSLKFLPTVRLLKYWNSYRPQPALSSYYFETVCLKVFQNASAISDYPPAVKYFLDNAPTYLMQSCPDPKGLGPNLDADVPYDTKQKVQAAMKSAADEAWYGVYHEEKQNYQLSIEHWQKVFGSSFPSYG